MALKEIMMRQIRVWILLMVCVFAVGLSGCDRLQAVLDGELGGPTEKQLEEQVLQVIRDHPEVILESVQVYQEAQRAAAQQAQMEFSQRMQANPAGVIGNAPTLGADQKSLVLLEFSDFQCPYCAQARKRVTELLTQYPELTFAYKHYPLTGIHGEAQAAALAAWAAQQQGQFWPYHEALFEHQDELGEALYQSVAEELGLDLEQFEADRNSPVALAAIAADVAQADTMGISGTPFFILNGQVLSPGLEPEEWENALAQIS